jgi:hypothetical protein
MKPWLKEVATEYYQRALVARDSAERCDCPETRTYLLKLEQLWISQALRHDHMRLSTTRR